MTSQNVSSFSSTLQHFFRQTAAALLLTLALPVAVHAAKVATVPLAGQDFGHQNGVDVNSAPTTIEAQTRYYYRIEGTCHGTGAFATRYPNGTPIATVVTDFGGSASDLQGFYDNVGGGLPFQFINRHYQGDVSTPFGTANASLDLFGDVDATGLVK